MAAHQDPAPAWYVMLGGNWPGIKTTEPVMTGGKFTTPLPIMVKCHSYNDAEDVNRMNEVLKPLRNAENNAQGVINAISESPISATVLPGYSTLYGVVYGHHSGIYLSYLDTINEVNGIPKAIFRRISERNSPAFKRTMVYMLTKGDSEKGSSDWEQFGGSPSQSPPVGGYTTESITDTFRALSTGQNTPDVKSTPTNMFCSDERSSTPTPGPSQSRARRNRNTGGTPQSPSVTSGVRETTPIRPAGGSNSHMGTGRENPIPSQHSSQHSNQESPTADISLTSDHEPAGTISPTTYIYQHIRSLAGIVRTLFEPFHDTTPTPSLGSDADAYFQAHGFTHEAIMSIYHTYSTVHTVGEFVGQLAPRGTPVKELKFIWRIIRLPNELTWAHVEID